MGDFSMCCYFIKVNHATSLSKEFGFEYFKNWIILKKLRNLIYFHLHFYFSHQMAITYQD